MLSEGFRSRFEQRDDGTRGERAASGEFGADISAARHAAKCAESSRIQ